MHLQLRRIGNSQGIILPRPMLQQVGIDKEVDIEVVDGAIILRPAKQHPRDGWDESFAKATEAGYTPDDDLFEGMSSAFDQTEWQW
ncbi:AbrB/MazE/SpoVT family DNA-binding domain-containing protein [Spirosoma linguale]|uniref:Transcriptional regulator/antitoxin, MazE n=1 Tax=Spirosoma linguale (strain ATCC 33905 / DSM 74 / LMG 10896 / Claus 1) TaxID=504472 RepID=D2QFV9_SPILD|nr:transcriptional regulator/antitoxin, MazE [Spirosoma linguale DSM 74]